MGSCAPDQAVGFGLERAGGGEEGEGADGRVEEDVARYVLCAARVCDGWGGIGAALE